MDLLNLTGNLQ